jgi:hypothetical protein
VHGPVDGQVDTQHGGRIVYWNEPDGHQWELLTISYAREPVRARNGGIAALPADNGRGGATA